MARIIAMLSLVVVVMAGIVACGPSQTQSAADTPGVTTSAPTRAATTAGQMAAPATAGTSAEGDVTPSPAAARTTAKATAVITTRTVTTTESIPYSTRQVNDSSLAAGQTVVTTQGRPGVRTLTYQVTLTNGVQTAKTLIRSEETTAPVTKVITVGTKATPTAQATQSQSQCDPNYAGACVPIASDVDCAGGSGNGPAYVQGPVTVVGTDIYGLDGDGDGIGCELKPIHAVAGRHRR